ncbi:hypothetical protein MMC13_004659 [Lambiella insularis]|nr:hypothetical protein [Lambiella insularis]
MDQPHNFGSQDADIPYSPSPGEASYNDQVEDSFDFRQYYEDLRWEQGLDTTAEDPSSFTANAAYPDISTDGNTAFLHPAQQNRLQSPSIPTQSVAMSYPDGIGNLRSLSNGSVSLGDKRNPQSDSILEPLPHPSTQTPLTTPSTAYKLSVSRESLKDTRSDDRGITPDPGSPSTRQAEVTRHSEQEGSRMAKAGKKASKVEKPKRASRLRKSRVVDIDQTLPINFSQAAARLPRKAYLTASQICYSWVEVHPGESPTDTDLQDLGRLFMVPPDFFRQRMMEIIRDDSGYHSAPRPGLEITKNYQSKQPHGTEKETAEGETDPQRPYACTHRCGSTFKDRGSWEKHEQIAYPQRLWVCPEKDCHKRIWLRKDRFQSHLKDYHGYKTVSAGTCIANLIEIESQFPRTCFVPNCFESFNDWKHRINHIAKHYKKSCSKFLLRKTENDLAGDNITTGSQTTKDQDSDSSDDGVDVHNSENDFDDSDDDQGGMGPGNAGSAGGSNARQDTSSQGPSWPGPRQHHGGRDGGGSSRTTSQSQQYKESDASKDLSWNTTRTFKVWEAVRRIMGFADYAHLPLAKGPLDILAISQPRSSLCVRRLARLVECQDDHSGPEQSSYKLDRQLLVPRAFWTLGNDQLFSLRWLGSGATASVDEVKYEGASESIARKVIKYRYPGDREKAIREAYIMHCLQHPHIVRLLTSYSDAITATLMMQPAADYTLSYYLRTCSASAPVGRESWTWFGCLASGLQHMHDRGVFHGDIKPDNILISNKQVYYTDFGLSDIIPDDRSTISEAMFMTKQYAAPEVKRGKRGKPSDVWSLGCVFLELMTLLLNQNVSERYVVEYGHENRRDCDFSYSSNPNFVQAWIQSLRVASYNAQALTSVSLLLDLCQAMMDPEPRRRPVAGQLTKLVTSEICCVVIELAASNLQMVESNLGFQIQDSASKSNASAPGTTEKSSGNISQSDARSLLPHRVAFAELDITHKRSWTLSVWLSYQDPIEALAVGKLSVSADHRSSFMAEHLLSLVDRLFPKYMDDIREVTSDTKEGASVKGTTLPNITSDWHATCSETTLVPKLTTEFTYIDAVKTKLYLRSHFKRKWLNTFATLDSGTPYNWISQRIVKKLGVQERSKAATNACYNADGGVLRPYGTVRIQWYYSASRILENWFLVADNCCSDVILGSDFLFTHGSYMLRSTARGAVSSSSPTSSMKNWTGIHCPQNEFKLPRRQVTCA